MDFVRRGLGELRLGSCGGVTASWDRWQRKRCHSSCCGDGATRNLMGSLLVTTDVVYVAGGQQDQFLLLYQYNERALSSIPWHRPVSV